MPIVATDGSMVGSAAFRAELLVAECFTDHPAGRWAYVVGLHANPSDDPVTGTIAFGALGALGALGASAPTGDVVAWDWRAGTATRLARDATVPVALAKEGWTYLVLAPVLATGLAVIGDTSKLVPVGDARLEVTSTDRGARLVVKGAGETVTITGWAEQAPTAGDLAVDHDPATGIWTLRADVPERGWTTVDLEAGRR